MRFVRGRYVAHTVEKINVFRDLLGKRTGKKPFGRPGRKWEEYIETDLREIR
jgi:hypothetical protein